MLSPNYVVVSFSDSCYKYNGSCGSHVSIGIWLWDLAKLEDELTPAKNNSSSIQGSKPTVFKAMRGIWSPLVLVENHLRITAKEKSKKEADLHMISNWFAYYGDPKVYFYKSDLVPFIRVNSLTEFYQNIGSFQIEVYL